MRKVLYILLPIISSIILFSIIMFFLTRSKDKGALQVTSSPLAKVYLNGKSIGETPFCKCDLKVMIPTGEYTIKVVPTKGNFQPFEQTITISPKVLTVVDRNFALTGLSSGSIINLTPIEDKNETQISVISFPQGVQVFLDNNLQGQSPISLKKITESDHELKLTKEGYKDKIVRVSTTKGYKLEALIFLGINPKVATTSQTPISTPSAATTDKVLIEETGTGFLRVRSDASASASVISQVKPGQSYDLLEEKTGWFKIKVDENTSGWVSSQFAKKT